MMNFFIRFLFKYLYLFTTTASMITACHLFYTFAEYINTLLYFVILLELFKIMAIVINFEDH